MRSSSRFFVQSLLLAATASFSARMDVLVAVAEQELLLGSWRLDLVKSRYTPGPPPRSETRTYVRDQEGMKGTIHRRREDGREEVIRLSCRLRSRVPRHGDTGLRHDQAQANRRAECGSGSVPRRSRVWNGTESYLGGRPHDDDHVPPGRPRGILESNVAVYRKQ